MLGTMIGREIVFYGPKMLSADIFSSQIIFNYMITTLITPPQCLDFGIFPRLRIINNTLVNSQVKLSLVTQEAHS